MFLAIDCGNTNAVFGLHDGERWRAVWRISTDPSRTADEYAAALHGLFRLENLRLAEVDACVVSTVVPQSIFHFRNLSRRHFGFEPIIVQDVHGLGVPIRLDNPKEVGADRLVNAIAAYEAHGGPLIIIDSGTATTFDVISADGAFEGGVIAPGINLSLKALHEAAAKLPRIAIAPPPGAIGKNTIHAMQSGVYWGYIELIEGMVRRIREEYGAPMKVVATGGVVSLFEGRSRCIDVFDHDLTLRGLLLIRERLGGRADEAAARGD